VVQFEAGQAKDYDLTGLNVTKPSLEPAKDPAEALARPMVLEPGDEVPDFAMTTQDGQTVRLSELRGKVVALTFIYTRCPIPDFCPALDAKFADLASRLATVPARAERVRLLSISFDPDHDTPEVLRNHARMRGAKPPLWSFAVASHTELAKVAPGLGLSYGPDGTQVVHNRVTAVIDAAGKLARLEINGSWTPADLFKTLAELARKPAK
jgi:protein SCO1/2